MSVWRKAATAAVLYLVFLPASEAGEEPRRPFDPSALRFAPPASLESLAGTYRFTTRLGDVRTLRLALDPGGEKRLLATRPENPGDILLTLEADPNGPGLRGQARRDLDPCLGLAGLAHTLPLATAELILELGIVYPPAGLPPLPHDCPPGLDWMILAPSGQARVPVYPESSYRPAQDGGRPLTEVGPGVTGEYIETIDQVTRGQREPETSSEFERTINPPRVAGGTRVRITRTVRTNDGEIWLHVQVLAPGEGESVEDLEALDDLHDDRWLEDPDGSETEKRREEESPVSSGYVRPEHVHARVTYTLRRVSAD